MIGKVRSGEVTHIALQINEHNQNMILEGIDGNQVLVIDELPTTYHGCYLYNNGVFPYAIKSTLSFIILNGGEDDCLTRIISVDTEPGTRFNFQGYGQPIMEDPNGDSCVWEVDFEVVPMPTEPRHYLMRWNPSISSFKEKDYKELLIGGCAYRSPFIGIAILFEFAAILFVILYSIITGSDPVIIGI